MMSSGKNRLMLMMALTMPGAAHALGLGEIHVDSALNERLAAEIDIVGATALELTDLRAAVANRETFLRYGADRPGFLSSATFKVSQDSQGRPVLAVRSSESFTEPVVNLLVDLRWSHGEVVRQYTLLLDPAVFASVPAAPVAPDVPAAPPAATPVVETKTQTMALQADPPADQPVPMPSPERLARTTTHIKVGAKATLHGIAWRVGERSESDLQRMMIAIFRANPSAFDGNINRLHLGAVLTIPAYAELAAISKGDAKREFHAQMAAWHSPARSLAAAGATPSMSATAATTPAAAPDSAATAAAATTAAANTAGAIPAASASGQTNAKSSDAPTAAAALGQRIQSLEHELGAVRGQLESERDQMLELEQRAIRANNDTASVAAAPQTAVKMAHPKPGYAALAPVAVGMGVLAAALAGLYFRFRRRAPLSKDTRGRGDAAAAATAHDHAATDVLAVEMTAPQPAPREAIGRDAAGGARSLESMADAILERRQEPAGRATEAGGQPPSVDPTQPMLPVVPGMDPAGRSDIGARSYPRSAPQDPTVRMQVDTVEMRMDPTRLDYNLVDLDLTAQHVHMPSALNEQAVYKERRTNLADVLKLALEREPDRHDLRMKLLELYYSAAATNRNGFLETVQKFAHDRDLLKAEEWDKIAYMGRQIASENPLFAEATATDDDLADCA
jgi:pilus assembly protein FimV